MIYDVVNMEVQETQMFQLFCRRPKNVSPIAKSNDAFAQVSLCLLAWSVGKIFHKPADKCSYNFQERINVHLQLITFWPVYVWHAQKRCASG